MKINTGTGLLEIDTIGAMGHLIIVIRDVESNKGCSIDLDAQTQLRGYLNEKIALQTKDKNMANNIQQTFINWLKDNVENNNGDMYMFGNTKVYEVLAFLQSLLSEIERLKSENESTISFGVNVLNRLSEIPNCIENNQVNLSVLERFIKSALTENRESGIYKVSLVYPDTSLGEPILAEWNTADKCFYLFGDVNPYTEEDGQLEVLSPTPINLGE